MEGVGDLVRGQGTATVLLAGTTAVLVLMRLARRSFWGFSLLALPGTVCHELCHWAVGHLLRGRPVRFTVVPHREGRGYVLGSVAIANLRWYNAFFIGLAPLLLLPAAWALFRWRLAGAPTLGWPEAALVFLLASLLGAALPSGQDLRIAARSPVGWLLLAGALGWGWHRMERLRGAVPEVRPRSGGTPSSAGSWRG